MRNFFPVMLFLFLWNMFLWNIPIYTQKNPIGFGTPQMYSSNHEFDDRQISRRERNKWIKMKVREMKSTMWNNDIELAEFTSIDTDDIKLTRVRISVCNKLHFENKDTILICTHSVHENPLIGDVSIALLNQKKVYVNFGHVCGGLINFENHIMPKNGADFFLNYRSDTDASKWKKWKSTCF